MDNDDIPINLWTVGIARGHSPFALQAAAHPVLFASDVTDVPAIFLADPFMLSADGAWHMFFEVLNRSNRRGEIGHATSGDGESWTYDRIVLREPFHLSYPCVFEWDGDYWMVPETLGANAIRLYRGAPFPGHWTPVADLVPVRAADPTLFRYDGRWWMFACLTPYQHRALGLYYADNLTGPWQAHPRNPIVEDDPSIGRPGGRVLIDGGRLYRFAQDSLPAYGRQVRALEIIELTPESYREAEVNESPVLTGSGEGWNAAGMHHLDVHKVNDSWIACVDGRRE
ncbi:MAG TPA: hypothetical protein VHY33_01825 [Thermoanaerobaculia bacterium]|jgi:hypothetical protein|nr:hypothetical protein [Thermoanaerobaculia bacterium]